MRAAASWPVPCTRAVPREIHNWLPYNAGPSPQDPDHASTHNTRSVGFSLVGRRQQLGLAILAYYSCLLCLFVCCTSLFCCVCVFAAIITPNHHRTNQVKNIPIILRFCVYFENIFVFTGSVDHVHANSGISGRCCYDDAYSVHAASTRRG